MSNEVLESSFPKLSKSFGPLSKNRDPNMTQKEHVYVICGRQEADDDIISGRNVKILGCYIAVIFEVASSSSFRDFQKRLFCDSKVGGDGSGGVNVVFSRPEVTDDVYRVFPRICLYKYVQ